MASRSAQDISQADRHNRVAQLTVGQVGQTKGEQVTAMILVNFSHPLTAAQLVAIETLAEEKIARIIEVKTHFNEVQPYTEQLRALIEATGLTAAQWQQERLLINPPSLSAIATLVMAELHGRMGYFPTVLRLRPITGSAPPLFEVAEILNLQAVREQARQQR